MTDELTQIIARQDKLALDEYADARGIKLDRRKGFASMVQDFEAEQEKDKAMNAEQAGGEIAVDASELDAETQAPAPEQTTSVAVEAEIPAPDVNVMDVPQKKIKPEPSPERTTLALDELEEMTRAWAATFAREVKEVTPTADGMTLRVRIVTRHGTSTGEAKLAKWSRADIKKALEEIRPQMA